MIDYDKRNKITYKQIDVMKHAIGFNNSKIKGTKHRRYEPYRNYFCAGESDMKDWNELVEIGFAENWNKNCFCITNDAKQFLYYVTGVEILDDLK